MKNLFTSSVSDEKTETGCTLIYFPDGGIATVDVRGGAAATREDASISLLNLQAWVDAIVLSGGSTYGLEAACGVMQKISEKRNHATTFNDIPCVPSACVYDFRNRKTSTYPDISMGRLAFEKLQNSHVDIGAVGGGTNTFVGKILKDCSPEKAGVGAYFTEVNGCSVLAITVVNALGNILSLDGQVLKGSLHPDGTRKPITQENLSLSAEKGNTTISCLITNAKLSRTDLHRLAVMVHTSMARVIAPFHTPYDGDVLYAVVPNGQQVEVLDFMSLACTSSLAMQKAVLSSV